MQAPMSGMPQAEPQEEKGEVQELVVNIHEGMTKLAKMIDSTNVLAPEEKQEFQALMSGFEMFIEKLSSTEQPAGPKPMPGQNPMEMGGNKNARPVMM